MSLETFAPLSDVEVGLLSLRYEDKEPQAVLRWAVDTFPRERLAICTSFQLDGIVILDLVWRIDPGVRVFTIDTGRLPEESYDFIDQVAERYGISIEVYTPEADELRELVSNGGFNLFYRSVSARMACCEIRKVRPLQRVLAGVDAWVTGLRRDQVVTRAAIRKIERDHQHGGIIKINPLADWTDAQIRHYVETHNLPRHPLYEQGYRSIGCAPCTRPVSPDEDARAGRWWWEVDAPKECGMHCSIESGSFQRRLQSLQSEGH